MRVSNIHERTIAAPGALLDTLASRNDALWPSDRWPAMRLDRALGVGATGGHGPIRYVVEEYEPGKHVRFRFTSPRGFDGTHAFTVHGATLRHELDMRATGPALLTWPLVFRPLHDALIEDALDRAASAPPRRWSAWVRLLRWILRPRRRHA